MLYLIKFIISFEVIQFDNINPPVLVTIVIVRMYKKQLICSQIFNKDIVA